MVGKNAGLVTKIRNKILYEIKGERPKFVGIHCIIHQEVLASKVLKMEHVMNPIIKTVNFIKSRELNHRQITQFLNDLDEKCSDISYFAEVRWLSRGSMLKRFFELRKHVVTFMAQKGKPMEHSDEWWLDFAFLVDMTEHLNNLNVKLQEKNVIVTQLYSSSVQAFKIKLKLWEPQLREQKLDHFPSIRKIGTYNADKLADFSYRLLDLIAEFDFFADFSELNTYDFPLFNDLFTFDVGKAPTYLQMELIDLQCDTAFKKQVQ
ncbi:general transcription factor II-I repeat domain-containing protein 2-like [Centruroides sculpturatus]|uniref:general transcription factor II-I repeat domain-containing protein 2-like n=1 Tax=Centruroides sculpturatus TaxID=218467 RepID=UPI000C6DA407|nr:general transcription factor II-I repeat domain-containing protein 2-like [Centruroides sculpturatus]